MRSWTLLRIDRYRPLVAYAHRDRSRADIEWSLMLPSLADADWYLIDRALPSLAERALIDRFDCDRRRYGIDRSFVKNTKNEGRPFDLPSLTYSTSSFSSSSIEARSARAASIAAFFSSTSRSSSSLIPSVPTTINPCSVS